MNGLNDSNEIRLMVVDGVLETLVQPLPLGITLAAHAENGFILKVSEGVVIHEPVLIHYQITPKASLNLKLQNEISLGKNAQLSVFQDFQSDAASSVSLNAYTLIHCAEGSKLHYVKLQQEGAAVIHLSENLIEQAAESEVLTFNIALGAKQHRESWQVNLNGSAARCESRGLSIANNAQQLDSVLTMNHQAKACISEQNFKSIATDKSRTLFSGKVVVPSTGQQAEAHQLSQNLLLSALAQIETRPELEIYADEVKCSHGATVGQLDPEALFYLQSRGIDQLQASNMLLKAFVQDHLLDQAPWFQNWVSPLLEKKIGAINEGKAL